MLNCIGSIENLKKTDIIQGIIKEFNKKYPDTFGEAYIGYPIYVDEVANKRVSVDLALITMRGVFIINILLNAVTNYSSLQDDIYLKVESKFKKQPFLVKKRQLIFDFNIITYSCEAMEPVEGNDIAFSISELIEFINYHWGEEDYSKEDLNKILSGIQEAYGINNRIERTNVDEGTKAYLINEMNNLIEKYDRKQMEAILSDTSGIQRIRGMAGSGKTIILARKVVELHTAHPNWTIVVTYSTRSLKNQLVNLISKFYAAKNDGAKYDDTKVRVMHSWGSSNSVGVYYDICLRHGISPLNLNEAKAKFGKGGNLFSKMCALLLKEIECFEKMYDCILIDEAQDFDKNFMNLCLKVLDKNERLIYAYDELQKLNEESMLSPQEIFGKEIQNDTPLTVCYRNQGKAIVTAHAMGMGLYRKEGLIQIPSSSDVWKSIGYFSDSEIVDGKEAILYRTEETSPPLLKVDKEEIIDCIYYDNSIDMYTALLEMLNNDLLKEQLMPSDIMIIDMDTYSYNDNITKLYGILYFDEEHNYKLSIHKAGTSSPEDFFRKDSVVYSSILRAKGNETFMVYVINAQKCVNSLAQKSDRNGLFTAITRSKGWIRVLGYGEEMHELCEEFKKVKLNDYKLHFKKYPTKEEQKQLFLNNKDLGSKDLNTIGNARSLINKLRNSGSVSDIQILQELFGVTKDELKGLLKQIGDE